MRMRNVSTALVLLTALTIAKPGEPQSSSTSRLQGKNERRVQLTTEKASPASVKDGREPKQTVEVTKVDFTALPTISSSNLSVFGITLGMNEQDVISTLQRTCPQCSTKLRESTEQPVLDVTLQGDNRSSFSIRYDREAVDQLWLHRPMKRLLIGRSQELLTPEAYTKDSPLRLELLGREDNMTPQVDVGTLHEFTRQTYVYAKEGLQLETVAIRSSIGNVDSMTLVLTRPARAR
jgi:hypothetical protein